MYFRAKPDNNTDQKKKKSYRKNDGRQGKEGEGTVGEVEGRKGGKDWMRERRLKANVI